MRTRFAVTVVFFVALALNVNALTTEQKSKIVSTGDNSEWNWQWKENGKSLEVMIRGKVSFNDDYTEITGISRDGSLRVTDERGRTAKRFEAVANPDGSLRLSYSVDGELRPFNEEARAWLAVILN